MSRERSESAPSCGYAAKETMSTALEVEAKLKAAAPTIAAFAGAVNISLGHIVDDVVHLASGREVCARRARKIRKRGDQVRYVGRTTTGKARYRWLPAWGIALRHNA